MESGVQGGGCGGAANLRMLVECATRLVHHLGARGQRHSTTVTPRVRRRMVIRRVARLLVQGRPKARVVSVRTLAAADLPAAVRAVPRALSPLEVHARELLLHAGNVVVPPGRGLGIPTRIRALEGSHSVSASVSASPPRVDNFRQLYCEKQQQQEQDRPREKAAPANPAPLMQSRVAPYSPCCHPPFLTCLKILAGHPGPCRTSTSQWGKS